MMEKRCNGFHSSKSLTFHRKCYFPAVIFCVIVFSGKKMCSRTNQNNKLCTSLKNCKITVNYFLCVCGYRTFTQQPRKVCIFVSFTFGWLFFFTFSIPTFSGKLRQDLVSVSHLYYPTYYKSSNVHISAKHFLQVAKEASKIWIHIFQCIEKAYKTSYQFGSTTVQDGGSPACSLLKYTSLVYL